MSANLILPVSRTEAAKPYKFKATNISVYSFEEALYHCFRYWKQSVDDFASDEFVDWVKNTLGLSYIASKIREISEKERFSDRLVSFLSITDYTDTNELNVLRKELEVWEFRSEWEKLRERADDLMNGDEPEKAFLLYRKALLYEENATLFNNAAIALMKQGDYSSAADHLCRAMELEPENTGIMLHLAEAYILAQNYDSAALLLDHAEKFGENSDIYYLRGEIRFMSGSALEALPYYEKAIELKHDAHYIYRLADIYARLRLYERAMSALNGIKIKDKLYLKKMAELYIMNNNVPAAIKCMEKALISNRGSVDLWTRLAAYHRMDYDLNKAYSAIMTALGIEPQNPRANLEYARIRKAQGRIKDYQVILNGILAGLKEKYRENAGFE